MSSRDQVERITNRMMESNRKNGHHVPREKVRAEVVRHARRRDIQGKK